jgi:hypothetical protein
MAVMGRWSCLVSACVPPHWIDPLRQQRYASVPLVRFLMPRLAVWAVTASATAAALLAVALLAVVLLVVGLALPPAAAMAAARPAAQHLRWLVKSNDLALLQRQASKDGRALPLFTWVGCGGRSDPDACRSGQDPIFTSYWPLKARAQADWTGTAIFDIEEWRKTPAEQRLHPRAWICRAARLQHADPGLKVIITPYDKPAQLMVSEDVAAAKCGAYGVDIQSQFINGYPKRLAKFIHAAVAAIRNANRRIIILAGLATNNPRVEAAGLLAADYHAALANGVQGFWLNANNWQGENHCKAAQGGAGCPQIGVKFLADIGMTRLPAWQQPPAADPNEGLGPGLRIVATPPW